MKKILVLFLCLGLCGCARVKLHTENKKLEETGKWEETYEEYKAKLEQHPKDSKIKKELESVGQKASKLRFEKAKSLYESKLELNTPTIDLEQSLKYDPQNKEAAKLLDELQQKKKKALDLLATSSEAQKNEFNFKAVTAIREASKLFPDSSEIQKAVGDIEARAMIAYREKAALYSAEQRWKNAYELYKELNTLFPEDKQITKLFQELEIKIAAQDKAIEAENFFHERKFPEALNLAREALFILPEYEKALQLQSSIKLAIAQEYVEKGRLYFKEGNWIEALKQYNLAEEYAKDIEGLKELKENSKDKLVEFYYDNAMKYFSDKKFKEAFLELLKIFDYKKDYSDVRKKLEAIRNAWADDLNESISEHESKGEFGSSLLKSVALEMLYPKKEKIQKKINELESNLKDRVTFRIAIFGIENFSQNPELGGRLVDGVFEFLLKKSIDTLQIVDRSSEDSVRFEAKLTGAELAKLKPISAFIDGSVYPLKIDMKQEIARETKKVQVGTIKSPNPRRAEIIARMNTIGSTIPGYQSQYFSESTKSVQDFGSLYQMSQAYPQGYPGWRADAWGSLFGMLNALQAQSSYTGAQSEVAQLQQQLNSIPEFIEEPRYATIETGGDNYIKTARLKCYLKIRDFKTRQPFFTREIEEVETVVDKFVKGDEEAGVKSDPLELPTDTELGEKVIQNLINKAGNILYEQLENYGYAYYNLAKQSVVSQDNFIGTERCFDFLSSYTARFYPGEASDAFTYLEARLKEIVPNVARKKDADIKELFPEVKQVVEEREEQKRKAKLYEEKLTLARTYLDKKDWQSAISEAEEALKVEPDKSAPQEIISNASREQRKESLLQETKLNLTQNNFVKTVELATALLSFDPDNSEAKNLKFKAELKILPIGFSWQGDNVVCEKDKSEMIMVIKTNRGYSERFLIDKYEVTNKQFSQFISETKYKPQGKWKQYYKENQDNYPVRNITVYDAQSYVSWAGKMLPSEAEWEYAARKDLKKKYPWGNEFNLDEKKSETLQEARPVGTDTQDVSEVGCYDMAGNVSEFIRVDRFPYIRKQILRGGSFENKPVAQTYDTRIEATPLRAFAYGGFRSVVELDDVKQPTAEEAIAEPNLFKDEKSGISLQIKAIDTTKTVFQTATEGVVISDIAADSQAEKSGLKKGDIITEVNRKPVKDSRDFINILTNTPGDLLLQTNTGYLVLKRESFPQTAAHAMKGIVIVINKEYNFLVVDLGEVNGIKSGNTLSVYHDQNYLGDIKVTNVHKNYCSAEPLAGSPATIYQVQVKDRVVSK
jgi:tetratricopeptide (TPR) repeat protein